MELRPLDSSSHLQRELAQRKDKMYLLIDGARFDNIHAFLYKIEEQPDYAALYRGTYFESALEVSPYLVRLKSMYEGLLPWYLDEGAREDKAIVIATEENIKDLAEHFRKFIEARLPTQKIVIFRFYDPNILNALAPFNEKPQIKALLKPCTALYWQHEGISYTLQ